MLVFGSSIGEGNYQPILNEVINCQSNVALTTLDNKTGFSDVAATTLNLEADSAGMIGKGVKAIHVSMATNDSGSAGTEEYAGYQTWRQKAKTIADEVLGL